MNRTLKEQQFSSHFKLSEKTPIPPHPGGILLSQEKFTLNPTASYTGQVFDTEEGKPTPKPWRTVS